MKFFKILVLVNQQGTPVNNTDVMDKPVNACEKSNDGNELEYQNTQGTYINVKKSMLTKIFFLHQCHLLVDFWTLPQFMENS